MALKCENKLDFIEKLYEYMQDYDAIQTENKVCFLSGAFVFEDPKMNLFKLMTIDCDDYEVDTSRSGFFTKTHSSFFGKHKMTQKRISKKRNSKLARKQEPLNVNINFYRNHSKKQRTLLPKLHINFQYQILLKEPIQYICDNICLTKPEHPSCKDNYEKKQVILFYPFKMIQNDGQTQKSNNNGNNNGNNNNNNNGNNKDVLLKSQITNRKLNRKPNSSENPNPNIYLFVKLEESKIISYTHLKKAIMRYKLHMEKHTSHPLRREDQSEKSYDIFTELENIYNKKYIDKGKDTNELIKDFKTFCSKYKIDEQNNNEIPFKVTRGNMGKPIISRFIKSFTKSFTNTLRRKKKISNIHKKKSQITNKDIENAINLINIILQPEIPMKKNSSSSRANSIDNSPIPESGQGSKSRLSIELDELSDDRSSGVFSNSSPIPTPNSIDSFLPRLNLSEESTLIAYNLIQYFVQSKYEYFQHYLEENERADTLFIEYLAKNLDIKEDVLEKIKGKQTNYNEKIRSSNELFIPYEISEKIIDKILTPNKHIFRRSLHYGSDA
jgi:hypothetical protein